MVRKAGNSPVKVKASQWTETRSWCFTINNYTDDDIAGAMDLQHFAKYVVLAFEIGDQGTPHIQGYVYFIHEKKRDVVIRNWLRRAAMFKAIATNGRAAAYCQIQEGKTTDIWEYGDEPTPGMLSKDRLTEVMAKPLENFGLYNQYRRAYREYMSKQFKDHDRTVIITYPENRFKYMVEASQVCTDMSCYDGEKILVFESIDRVKEIELVNWLRGFPMYTRRGYEVIKIDPEVILFLAVSYKDASDYTSSLDKTHVILDFKVKDDEVNAEEAIMSYAKKKSIVGLEDGTPKLLRKKKYSERNREGSPYDDIRFGEYSNESDLSD